MTNSTATVIRQRRPQPAKAWFVIGGLLLVAATIPLSIMNQDKFSLPDFGAMFQSNTAEKKVTAEAPIAGKAVFRSSGNDSAAYVQVLDGAARSLSAEINKSPSDPSLQNRLGLIYLTLGDLKSAEQCFMNAVSLSRGSISGYANQVERLRKEGNMAGASKIVLEASKVSVELSAAHSNLARVYEQRGDRQAVIAELDQINKDGLIFNGFAGQGGKLKSKDGMLSTQEAQQLAQAEALFKSSQLPAALVEYNKLAQANPKLAFAFDRIGLISVMTGDLSGGVSAWEKAAKLNPGSATIRSNLGLAYHQMGMEKESEDAFRKALVIDPSMEEAALNLGELLSARGDLASAISVLKNSVKHNPGSARAQNNLGTYLSLSGNYPDAISAFHQAIKIDAAMASAHYGMGVALMKTHKYM
ncbi:MAG: tetratricopeptide repeat protein, partial [Candidatus Obscuribacterales bacterium]|nr:tetratricopeptide repeat protein [Candidatus Obscuribacterales bacterium]